MKTTLLALALTTVGTAALADNTVTLSYGGFEKNDATTSGLVYDFEGDAYGFGYEGYVFDGDVENVDAKLAGAKINWTGVDAYGFGVGPAVSYNYGSIAGINADDWAAGVAVKGAFGRHEIEADALVSLDDKEIWAVTLSGETPVGRQTTILSDYTFAKNNSEDQQLLALGARYDVTPTAYVEGQALVERSFSDTGAGLRAGVGFRF